MPAIGIVAVRIFAGIEEHAYDFRMTMLCGEGDGDMPLFGVSGGKQTTGFIDESQTCGRGEAVGRCATPGQLLGGIQISELQGCHCR